MTDFWKQLYTTCMERETTPNEVAKNLGISSGAVSNWKLKDVITRGNVNNYKTSYVNADYFNVSVDYLLGKEKEPSVQNGEFDELTMQFNNLLGKLSQEQKEALIPLLESMIQQKK